LRFFDTVGPLVCTDDGRRVIFAHAGLSAKKDSPQHRWLYVREELYVPRVLGKVAKRMVTEALAERLRNVGIRGVPP
jgi:hypothetical protein